MGDYFAQTFEKCVVGVIDAALRGREPTPSTQENCAVAKRELEEMVQDQKRLQLTPVEREKLIPPPKARPSTIFKKSIPNGTKLFFKKVEPKGTLKDPAELLQKLLDDSLPAEHGKRLLKNLGKQFYQNKLRQE